jgi:hypothetical protein
MGSVPMPMPSQAQRHSSLPSQAKRQTSSISDPGDDQFLSEFYRDNNKYHAPLSQLSTQEQESALDQDEALACCLQDKYEGLSRHHSSSTTMKSDKILLGQMEELMREQQQDKQACISIAIAANNDNPTNNNINSKAPRLPIWHHAGKVMVMPAPVSWSHTMIWGG